MSKGFVAITLLAALALPQGVPQVPAALVAATTHDPYAFLMVLTEASVPAGLEVRSSDQYPRLKPHLEFERSPTIAATEVVAAFNAHHVDYRAMQMDGVFVIRPAGRTAAYLESDSPLGRVDITGVMNAGRRIFNRLDATLGGPGGVLGSSMVDAEEAGHYAVISLDGDGRKVIDLLNQVVEQSRPRAWVVVTSDDRENPQVKKFGFMHRGGASTFVDVGPRK